MSFNIPNTFIAGTKAKADEVNKNFTAIGDELNTQSANIQVVKNDLQTCNNYIKNELLEEINDIASAQKTKFCVNYGNLDANAKEDLITIAEHKLTFKVGGLYPVLIATNAFGDSDTFEYLDEVDLSGYADGIYNLFLGLDGTFEVLKNTIYRQSKVPTDCVINDIWFMNMEPNHCYKFNGLSWLDYEKIPIGNFTIKDTLIAKVSTFQYNQNGKFDIDCASITKVGRNHLSKRYETEWMDMPCPGVYMIRHYLGIPVERTIIRLLGKFKVRKNNWLVDDIIHFDYANTMVGDNTEAGFALWLDPDATAINTGSSVNLIFEDKADSSFMLVSKNDVRFKVIITEDIN